MPNSDEGKSNVRVTNKSGSAKPKSSAKNKTDITPKVVSSADQPANDSKKPAPVTADPAGKPTMVGAMVSAMKEGSSFKSVALRTGLIALGLVLIVVIVFGVLIYGYKSNDAAVVAVAQVVPYPAESVNGHFVSYSSYLFEVNAEERAYDSNAKLNNQAEPNFTSSAGQKLAQEIKQHAMQKLASDSLVDQLAAQNGIKVTSQQVQGPINALYSQYGGKATLLKTLNQIYGWNLNDLQNVVKQQLIAQDLQNKVSDDPAFSAASAAKAQNILQQLKNGADFSTLAKQNSQSSDASSGGNMGYFSKGQVPTDIYSAAASLQMGQLSNVIHDQYGYVIVKVLGTKPGGSIEAQEILIKNVDYNSYFQTQLNKAKINTFIKV